MHAADARRGWNRRDIAPAALRWAWRVSFPYHLVNITGLLDRFGGRSDLWGLLLSLCRGGGDFLRWRGDKCVKSPARAERRRRDRRRLHAAARPTPP